MAGILEEFDDATPLRGTFCSRVSVDEFEKQSSSCTKQALSELMDHLDNHPLEFKAVLRKRKRDEEEQSGLIGFVKVKLLTLFAHEKLGRVSDSECQIQLESLKEDMMKAFNYAQESRGRRYSKRLAERQIRKQMKFHCDQKSQSFQSTSHERPPVAPLPPPPPPPPPPLPPMPPSLSVQSTPVQREALTRRPLTERHNKKVRKIEKIEKKSTRNSLSHDQLILQLKGSECRKRLRKTACRSPGRTPLAISRKCEPDLLPFFNAKLSDKFRNAISPKDTTMTMASPGAFGSPM